MNHRLSLVTRKATLIGTILFMVACTDSSTTKEPASTETAENVEAVPEPEPEPETFDAHITGLTSLRKKPTKDRKIENEGGKKVSNWLATLYRGETVTVLEGEGEWSHVKSSGESEGWIEKRLLIPVDEVRIATTLEDIKIFKRPDLLALSGKNTIAAGSLIFVKKDKDQFSEVDYPRSAYAGTNAWVLSAKLNTDVQEVALAKLLSKIRHLQEKNDDDAAPLIEIAKEQYGGAKLIDLLQKSEAEKAPAAEAPTETEKAKEEKGTDPAKEG